MYKKKIIWTIVSFILNLTIVLIDYLSEVKELSALFVLTMFIFLCFVIYWIYILDRFALYPLLFGNFRKQKLIVKILCLICVIVFFVWTAFVYLIEVPKYTSLDDKLKEKDPTGSSIRKVTILDKKTNELCYYNQIDLKNEKLYSIFNVEFIAGLKAKNYIIYKCDPRYLILKAYAEITMYPEHDNKVVLNYLTVSFSAIKYYKKEIKNIYKDYNNYKKKYNQSLSDKKLESLMEIQKYLMMTKLNNMRYSDTVKMMALSNTYASLEEVKAWHNYFKNETDKESIRVNNALSKLNEDFKELISTYSNEDKKKINDEASKEINELKEKTEENE